MAIQDIYELSPIQQGMLSDSLAVKNSGLYLIQLSYALQGDLDVSVFEQAWRQVVARHDVLRTSFHWEGMEKPAQVVHDEVTLPFEVLDWSALPEEEQRDKLDERLQEAQEHGIEFTQPPLMRLRLFKLGPDRFHFLWAFHHILFEGWSASVLLKEMFDIYRALLLGESLELPAPKPYRDYIAWLRNQDMSAVEAFWRRELDGMTAPTPLGMGPRGNGTYGPVVAYDAEQLSLSAGETSSLETFARQNRLTMNTLAQAAWALTLSLYSRESQVVYGSIVSGRSIALEGVESMVGLFINILPTRVVIDWRARRLSWLKSVQQRQVEARQFEFTPLVDAKRWSGIEPGIPLFESIVVFENWLGEVSLNELAPGMTVRDVVGYNGAPGYPLAVVVEPGSTLNISITYDADRFDREIIATVLRHFKTILLALAEAPEKPLSAISFLTSAEETTLLREWTDTKRPRSGSSCIHERFEEAVRRAPEAIAVMYEDQKLTYAELNERAERVAARLQALGVGPEARIGLCVGRNPSMIVGLLGILKAGGAYVPLDPAYPEERLRFMISDSDVRALVTERSLEDALEGCGPRTVCLDSEWKKSPEDIYLRPEVDGSNLAYVIYTSGSTGIPKGVMTPHSAAVNYVDAAIECFEVTDADRILQFASISFDTAVEEIFPALFTGATLALRNDSMMDSMAIFLRTCAEWRISLLDLPTAFWHEMVASLSAENLKMPECLRLLIIGGESANPEHVVEWHARAGNKPRLFNTYGPTESTVVATMTELNVGAVDATRPVAIGRGIANAEAYVLDELLRPVPVGVAGELHIGGRGLARGYLSRPDLTADRFVPNPFAPEGGGRLYRTGDLVRYRNDGNLEFLGRVDNQIKIRGYRIEPGEIEAALRQRPDVSAAALIVDSNARLVAYVVRRLDSETDAGELRSFLKTQLPTFMIPQEFVFLKALPLTPAGKLDRRKLPEAGQSRASATTGFVEPRTPVETEVAAIWRELLKRENIGIHDNFFELGGHSLLAIQLLSRLRSAFDVEVPLRRLFESPTVEGVSIAIGECQIEKADGELMARMLSEMEGLSDDQAQSLLRNER